MARTQPTKPAVTKRGLVRTSHSLETTGELLLYETDDGRTRVECRFADETLWLTQALMAELFQTTPQNITLHLKALYQEGEIDAAATCKDYLQVRPEGGREVRRTAKHYNLDAILAVGYRVRSARGTQFRQWATDRLREYLVKGFTLDDERLKSAPGPGANIPDYFDELLERIRDIRASEARMYLRVREIFALAADYDPGDQETTAFFRVMQNKLHFAATGKTAAELITERADHLQPNMGLTSWKGGRVAKADVVVAKNYLDAHEIGQLNRIVVMWLDFAEDRAQRRRQIVLTDWESRLDSFLRFLDREVLAHPGRVSHQEAVTKAEVEYAQFAARRRAMLEAEGERDAVEVLESAAKQLSEPSSGPADREPRKRRPRP